MDHYLNSFVLLVFVPLAVLVLVFKTLVFSSNAVKLPPSPPRLPVIGNLHQLGRPPYCSLAALSRKYGSLILLKLGKTQTLVVSCPEIVKEIVKSHDVIFSNRPKSTVTDILFFEGRDIVFSSYGKLWKEGRKICTLQLLSAKRVQSFHPVMEDELSSVLKSLRGTHSRGEAVNLSSILVSLSADIILRCVVGRLYSSAGDCRKSLLGLFEKVVKALTEVGLGDLFPGMRWVDEIRGFTRRLRSTSTELDKCYSQLIQEHKKMSFGTDCVNVEKDFVDDLLQLDYHRMTDMAGLTHEQYIKTIIQLILRAMFKTGYVSWFYGNDLTTIVWMMAELLRCPRAMKKVQEEIRKVVGSKEKIEASDVDQMDYFKCVITETLRLHPPVPLLVPRETSKEVQIRGYTIPAKTKVLINCWAIQRDPQYWDRPDEFLPERFENSPVDFKGSESFLWIPFGFGRRICPGMTFGMAQIEYVVSNLLYWFDWKLFGESPEEMDMSESVGMAVHKKKPIHAVPVEYSP